MGQSSSQLKCNYSVGSQLTGIHKHIRERGKGGRERGEGGRERGERERGEGGGREGGEGGERKGGRGERRLVIIGVLISATPFSMNVDKAEYQIFPPTQQVDFSLDQHRGVGVFSPHSSVSLQDSVNNHRERMTSSQQVSPLSPFT